MTAWQRAHEQAQRIGRCRNNKVRRQAVRRWALFCRQALTGGQSPRPVTSGRRREVQP